MQKCKTIVIDDESRPRDVLCFKIKELCPQLEIIATAANADEAYQLCHTLHPDLVFLDINMPNGSGFDFLRMFKEIPFEVIFATAHQEYLLEAFKVSAIGYLLKPIEDDDLVTAVNSAMKQLGFKQSAMKYTAMFENLNTTMKDKQNLVIPCSDKYEIVAIDQLMYCEGSDKYTYIHVSDGRKILSSYYIGKYKTMLANYNFFVCHKSYIVNLAFVQSLNSSDMIIMSNGKEVPLARRRKVEFMEVIGS